MAQKIILIIIISFVKIGNSEETIRINNVFLCFITCAFYLAAQIKFQPFINEELNNFSIKSSVILLINIFLGIFCSVASDFKLIIILLLILGVINVSFILIIAKKYFVLQVITQKKEIKCLTKFINFFKKILGKGYFVIF